MYPSMRSPNLSHLSIKTRRILLLPGTVVYLWTPTLTLWTKRLLMKGRTLKYSKGLDTSRKLLILSTTLAVTITPSVMTNVKTRNRNIATSIFSR